MNAERFDGLLEKLYACEEARLWCAGKNLATAWETCQRGDWMKWLLVEMGYPWTATAWDEYRRIEATALAEYRRIEATALDERIKSTSWDEYERIEAPARAEFRRIAATAIRNLVSYEDVLKLVKERYEMSSSRKHMKRSKSSKTNTALNAATNK
jgi:hypothetical protein